MVGIDVIPWIHRADSLVHEKVIEWIKRLPKNSALGLEITQNDLSMYRKNMGRLLSADVTLEALTGDLAYAELILECDRRNITVVPIEHPFFYELALAAKPADAVHADIKREHAFARRTQMSVHRRRHFPVVCGLAHAWPFVQLLNSQGLRSRLKTDIFGKQVSLVERRLVLSSAHRRLKDARATWRNLPYFKHVVKQLLQHTLTPNVRTNAIAQIKQKINDRQWAQAKREVLRRSNRRRK